ncbi:hypothetical protein ACMA1D_09870 [Streptomyces sp. 796.1]|uniref:hypothetical protein n=1 Tax=Streptomyces sp. 796.1 TaxID=3163029 RepID=UPI0039C9A490
MSEVGTPGGQQDGTFTLSRTGSGAYFARTAQSYSWSGTVGAWGAVELLYPTERSVGASGVSVRATVAGPQLAECSYFGLLYGGRPSLTDGELWVAGGLATCRGGCGG